MRLFVLSFIACLIVLPVEAKYTGGSGTAQDPYQIATASDLIALGETWEDYGKHFLLTADIDLDPSLPGRKVFDKAVIAPDTYPDDTLGYWGYFQGTPFRGVLDGNGHTISHLTIKGHDYVGLFGQAYGEIRNLGVVDVNIAGSGDHVGGLVGSTSGSVTQCYSTGAVRGTRYVGGLVGSGSYLVSQCYSASAVNGYESVGGLVGSGFLVTQCYSTGAVNGESLVGGLVGSSVSQYKVDVTYCYSTGAVTGKSGVGGLMGGAGGGHVTNCFWDTQTSGQTTSNGGTGKTTAEMQTASTFVDWGGCGWTIDEGRDYPHLAWENMPGQVIAGPTIGGGTGTAEDPYLIYTAQQLNSIGLTSCHWDRHFRLMADIDLSGFDGKDGRPAFNIIALGEMPMEDGVWLTPFTGVFDGNGHTISHLTITGSGLSHLAISRPAFFGLFGVLGSGAEVKDLGVVDVNITSPWTEYVGGLTGWNGGNVARCYSTGTVSRGDYVGGLVGGNGGTVTQCYSTAAVTGNWYVGGLVGSNSGAVTQCYSTGAVTGKSLVGGLIGGAGGDRVTNCFWDTQTSGQATSASGTGKTTVEMQTASTFLGWGRRPAIWTIDEGVDYPRLAWESKPGKALLALADFIIGSGSPGDPYLIGTPADLNTIGLFPLEWDKHFSLMANIDMSSFDGENGRSAFNVIGTESQVFTGVFDGDGHTISHLTIKGEGTLGLFGVLGSGAEVKDLGVVDVNITGSGAQVGGLVGYNGGDVVRCHATGTVSGGGNVGGLVGYNNYGSVTQCYSTGAVTGDSYVGGLVGDNWFGTVTQCYSTGAVSGGRVVGGLVGWNDGALTQCYSTGAVSGSEYVGGLVGYDRGAVTQCYSTGAVTGDSYVGGLVGDNWFGTVTQCYSTGAVKGNHDVGGLVGGAGGPVIACFWDTQTSGHTWSAGGTGKTTAQMQMANTFLRVGWDFVGETKNGTEDLWWILEGKDYPRLWWEAAGK